MANRVVIDMPAVRALLREPEARRVAEDAAREFADTARGFAAHGTGAGAASIHAESDDASGETRVSWDQLHYYMIFQETGTRFMPSHPALEPALDAYAEF